MFTGTGLAIFAVVLAVITLAVVIVIWRGGAVDEVKAEAALKAVAGSVGAGVSKLLGKLAAKFSKPKV